eukprot:scaffold279743_cov32-Tisochrysis_lutea.AAC.3
MHFQGRPGNQGCQVRPICHHHSDVRFRTTSRTRITGIIPQHNGQGPQPCRGKARTLSSAYMLRIAIDNVNDGPHWLMMLEWRMPQHACPCQWQS